MHGLKTRLILLYEPKPNPNNLAQVEAADAKASLEEVRRKLTKEQVSMALTEEQTASLSSNRVIVPFCRANDRISELEV